MTTEQTKLDITTETVKDTDLIMISNDQVLTSSLTVAEYFEKQHKNVMQAIEKNIDNLRKVSGLNFQPAKSGFIAGTYKDQQGKERPLYYLNKNAFSFVVMGFTGEKAAAWKWTYIKAFDRMEAALRNQQQNKPMTPLEMWKLQLQVAEDHERRLQEHANQISQVQADIKALRDRDNSMALRQQKININNQEQLNKHETDITDLQKSMYELLTEKADISQDMDIFISEVVRIYYQDIEASERYKTAWSEFYDAVAEEAGRIKGYIQNLKTRQRNNLISKGIAKTTADKRVTGKTVINSNPELKNAAIAVMTRISEDINAHEQEEE